MNRSPRRIVLLFLLGWALAAGGLFLWSLSLPAPLEKMTDWASSPVLLDRQGEIFSVFLSEDSEWCIPIPLSRMGKWIPLVSVDVEDRRFWRHPGADLLAIFRALRQNIQAGRIVSGASTITSQLVRLAVPRPRTPGTKIREFLAAMKAERHLSKERILELYLNRAPFGGNTRGVEAAARIYFSKAAADISLGEATLLVGMLRGPALFRPDRNPEAAKARRDSILASMAARGIITGEDYGLAIAERLPAQRGALPAKAYHFALLALGDRRQGGTARTTLDGKLQGILERTLSFALASLPREITAAGAVMENSSGDVLAYVGNARLGSGGEGSWVDCARRPRSPGSALKPFAYLAAFERGFLNPGSLLADTPLAFSGQAPRNFDMTYRGPVSARTALADSLNVPAVRVLRAAGAETVLDLLRNAGFRTLSGETAYYGDSLILGGCEVTVLQALEAYGSLAGLGIRRTPRFLAQDAFTAQRIASAPASFLIAEILKDTRRLLPLHGRRIERDEGWFAFKTGTSYGFRDAWTAAFSPAHTAVIWMGDPTGKPHAELVGLSAAVPPLLELFRHLPPSSWYAPPEGVTKRTICSLSGQPPAPACPSSRQEYAIGGISSTTPCSLHVFRDGLPRVIWPSELEEFALRRAFEIRTEDRLSIASPLPGSRYFLAPLGGEQRVALRAEGAKPPVYWFVSGEYAGRQERTDPIFWTLKKGKHTISMVDSTGRTASSAVTVEAISEGQDGNGPSGPENPSLLLMPGD